MKLSLFFFAIASAGTIAESKSNRAQVRGPCEDRCDAQREEQLKRCESLEDEEEQEQCRRRVGQNHRECLNGCSGGGPEPDCKTRCEQKHHEDMRKCNTLEDDAERERCAHQAQMNFHNCMEENCQRPE